MADERTQQGGAAEWTVLAMLKWTREYLREKGIASSHRDAEVLLAHALNLESRLHIYTRSDEVPDKDRREAFKAMLRKRVAGCPVDYLVGSRSFYRLDFKVTPDVLIPREETTLLVLHALDLIQGVAGPRVLDVGTGSGCVSVSVAKQSPAAAVTATDVSGKALAVARENAAAHNAAITFREGDLFQPVPGETFHVIVSNPPYIAEGEFAGLSVDVREYEPRLALDGGPDGLAVYRRLIPAARDHLEPGGHLLVEIGHAQEAAVRSLFEEAGGYAVHKTISDDAKHPRVIKAQFRP